VGTGSLYQWLVGSLLAISYVLQPATTLPEISVKPDLHPRTLATASPLPATSPEIYTLEPPMTTYELQRPGFVTRSAGQLVLDGRTFHFTGLNIYNANTLESCWYGFGDGADLSEALAAIGPGQNVFRAWFFQRMATGPEGQRDWSAMDRTLAIARANGERVIATLGNQWGDCEEQPPLYKTEGWYQSGYRRQIDAGLPNSYRGWVSEIVSRYRDDPTVLAWQLINEAEDQVSRTGPCARTAVGTLIAFTQDMAKVVKTADPNHLLSLGTWGIANCGTVGRDYQAVHDVAGIDLCEYHDYTSPAVPAALQNRLDQCRKLGKPLFVGETGIRAGQTILEARAAALDSKFKAQFHAGVVGELVWDWAGVKQARYSGFEVTNGDPTLSVLSRY